MMKKRRTIMVWTFLALFILSLEGCYMGEHYVAGEPFSEQALAGIKQGTMTKRDVLQWFGPPVAVARRGTTMTFPPAGMRTEGWEDIQSDTFFELFPTKGGNGDDSIVYYYYAPQIRTGGIFSILIAGGYTRRIVTDEVWLLIDEQTGRIEDFVLRTGENQAAASEIGEPRSLRGSDHEHH
jgi:hypothetical protein